MTPALSKTPSASLTTWRDPATEVRVLVHRWLHSEQVTDQYIEHPRSLRLVWNYFRKLGIRSVVQKLRSRLAEDTRNRKVFGIGTGTVTDAPDQSEIGTQVVFFAYNHSASTETVCLHQAFIYPMKPGQPQIASSRSAHGAEVPGQLEACIGWSPYSGIPLDTESIRCALAAISARTVAEEGAHRLSATDVQATGTDQRNVAPIQSRKPSAVLFGLGNYAKTAILPNIRPYLSLQRIHEIDPDQLAYFRDHTSVSFDTSPIPRSTLDFDAWFVAGFHHSHADLAIAALERGAYAVIEKPLATTRDQHQRFLKTATGTGGRFFVCFHKRYSELHTLAMRDLELGAREPIDMHCIVYEIPLPKRHWYNWPNSGSRLISNGCHWIDYFMFVNSYAPAIDYRVWRPRGSDVSVQVRLDNGAYLVMSLTDTGSQRLGVRDHIELRKGGTTVTMVDGSVYRAENRHHVVRRNRVNPGNAYARMYQHIGRAIAAGGSGDSLETLRSSELTLLLEAT